jgi:Na+-translocating ferredoxin:NAD+ oxidoreductase RnfG subunit
MESPEHWLWLPVLTAPTVIAAPAYAVQYLTVEEAQRALFPEAAAFGRAEITLSVEQKRAVEKAAGVRVRNRELAAWRASADGGPLGWFLVDEVLGKHELITYAVALDTNGAVQGIEILDYRETHGDEVRDARWRAQFAGKRAGSPLELDEDIANIAGATLSCKHVTEGVRRLLATWEVALK